MMYMYIIVFEKQYPEHKNMEIFFGKVANMNDV